MSAIKKLELFSVDEGSLKQLAVLLGSQLKGGETIDLVADLGGGKTTFVKYLVESLEGGTNTVSSPTFTVSKIYKTKKFEIHHYDLYRIGDNLGLIDLELQDIKNQKDIILIFEWSKYLNNHNFNDLITIEIHKTPKNHDLRNIKISTNISTFNLDRLI